MLTSIHTCSMSHCHLYCDRHSCTTNTACNASTSTQLQGLLGRVALVRGVAACSRQTFPWTICQSVGLSSVLWKNGASDPDAVWHRRSDGSSDEAGSGVWGSVHGKGYFWGEFGARHCKQRGLYGVRVDFRSDAALFPNYFRQTCYYRL